MQFKNTNYYSAMDYLDNASITETKEEWPLDPRGKPIVPDEELNFTAREIGTTTNPMTGQVESLKARIREGASRIEFEFLGQGKGNSQRPTPESFGTLERQDIRELLNANEMRTSTHAGIHSDSLAGFSREGFNSEARANVLKEIKKAINFAGEATKGGAVVFHTSEWMRPMSEIKDSMGTKYKFKGHSTEDEDAVLFAIDDRTGRSAGGISKDQEIFRPIFMTAKDYGISGKTDKYGNKLEEGDWVDVQGNKIAKDADIQRLFDRVPKFNEDKTNFEVEKLTFKDIVREADDWNKNHPKEQQRTPAEMAAILQLENQVLQYKGNSLYHARTYKEEKKELEELRKTKSLIEEIKKQNPSIEPFKLRTMIRDKWGRMPGDNDNPEEWLNDRIKFAENSLRHIHESSASADVMAKEAEERIKHIKAAEKYGITKTAETIALAGMEAMAVFNKNKEKYDLKDPIYVAPENWDPKMYGSHPDEYRKVIDESRKTMTKMLEQKGYSESEAKEMAKKHIKGTLDIGHMNMFRSFFQGSEKDFEKWLLDQTEKLVKEGYVGHIHLTDNFGYDDEHITPGQGNVPMKEFLRRLEKAGVKDIIVEQGSYNPQAHLETLELVNSPIYGIGRRQRFSKVRNAHFGYNAPGFFVAGAYVPSNDWKPWTDIGLE